MPYNKTIWVNDAAPALNAANLNKIENQLEALTLLAEEALPSSQKGAASGVATLDANARLVQAAKKLLANTTELTIGNIADGQYVKRVGSTLVGFTPEGGGNMDTSIYDTDNDGVVDAAESVPWSGVTGKPTTFPPNAHAHTVSDITGLSTTLSALDASVSSLTSTVNGKAPMSHTHTIVQVDGLATELEDIWEELDSLAATIGEGGDFVTEGSSPVFLWVNATSGVTFGSTDDPNQWGRITGSGSGTSRKLTFTAGSASQTQTLEIGVTMPAPTYGGKALVLEDDERLLKPLESFVIPLSDEKSQLQYATRAATFRMPYDFELTEVRASLNEAASGVEKVTVDIKVSGVSILSTKLSIDNGERTSVTASVPPVITSTLIPDNAEVSFDIIGVGDGSYNGVGLKVTLIGRQP